MIYIAVTELVYGQSSLMLQKMNAKGFNPIKSKADVCYYMFFLFVNSRNTYIYHKRYGYWTVLGIKQ